MNIEERVQMLELSLVGMSQKVEALAGELASLRGEITFVVPEHKPQFYTIADLVILTGISKSTIMRMIKQGEFPRGRKMGAQTVYPRGEVEKHLATLPPAEGSPFK